ncbi:hypothetical protein GOP47_0017764 [Adiantum capillus-veneris]|uniref:Uncharacterized protein n=1 Tax=Adiantum capillus-veneris TaxID=13818 RepID=A0A9D4UG08_ADICA|nr:hypothetical protein GOP47_0017764 [Adiantum capillus-veneris]
MQPHLKAGAGPPTLRREVYRIASEEGLAAFWKGNAVTILHRIPYSTTSFYAYQHYKEALTAAAATYVNYGADPGTAGEMGINFFAGAGAGMTASSLAYPLDLVRTRLSAQTHVRYYRGIGHALHTIARDEGLRGFYKGLGPSLLTVAPAAAINFAVYGSLKSAWTNYNMSSTAQHQTTATASTVPWSSLVFGSIAGTVSSTATFPLDLLRRRKQLEGAPGRPVTSTSHLGLWATFREIARTEGYRGLFRGIGPDYLKVVPTTGIMFTTFEFVRARLQHRSSKQA